jgi:hypothetical protein
MISTAQIAFKETALTQKGNVVNGCDDSPNRHDILVESQSDGTAFIPAEDRICGNRLEVAQTVPRWSSS